MQYLALCCIVKDESPYIKEWVLYHSLIGVEHFFIYDNGSSIPVSESLGELAASLRVTILAAPNKAMQLPAYNHCLTEFGNNFQWIAFADVDEFICPAKENDLRRLLAAYEPYGALALSWRLFSSSGHETRPQGLVIENYTRYVREEAAHIKSIVQPRKTSGCRNPHAFGYLPGHYCVNEAFDPLPPGAAFWPPSHEKAWVNHYYYKSREDFALKLGKGRNSVHQETQPWWNMELFDKHLALPDFPDKTITRFVPRLRKSLRDNALHAPFTPPQGLDLAGLLTLSSERLAAGHPEEALTCLCHAAMRQESHDIWTMRATFARLLRDLPGAGHFLRQASRLGESLHLYAEMAELALAATDRQKAEDAVALLRMAMQRSNVAAGPWAERLGQLESRLG